MFVQDLGGDHIYQYDIAHIIRDGGPFVTHKMPPGSGPRHITFSADGNFVYILNELGGSVDVYSTDAQGEIHTHLQNIVTDEGEGENSCAEIRLSPDGRFLYATNRAQKNSISVFRVNTNGTLKRIQVIASEGDSPRNFNFSPDGNWVIVAHQKSDNLSVFARDPNSGFLSFSGMKIDIPSPVCVVTL